MFQNTLEMHKQHRFTILLLLSNNVFYIKTSESLGISNLKSSVLNFGLFVNFESFVCIIFKIIGPYYFLGMKSQKIPNFNDLIRENVFKTLYQNCFQKLKQKLLKFHTIGVETCG